MTGFADYFSGGSREYAEFRPGYPRELGAWLAQQVPGSEFAWDCGTGSGQAAGLLAEFFSRVLATDPSQAQLQSAPPHPRVEYRPGREGGSGLEDSSVSLVTAAQAVHWFDRPAFWSEVRRVLRPDGLLAVWGYGLPRVDAQVDLAIDEFYGGTIGPFWPPERRLVESGYRDLDFPFPRLHTPDFQMQALWTRSNLLGYVGTWSAVTRYHQETGIDPADELADALESSWPEGSAQRRITWPLFLIAGRPS